MTRKTYWFNCPRDFGNEYEIGIATSKATREWFKLMGYERISRERALRDMTWNGDQATQAYVSVRVDDLPECEPDRFEVARLVLAGEL